MTTFAITNNLLSDRQKSAQPSEGCYEHTFLLQSLINYAKHQQKNIFITWLDIKNAFESISTKLVTFFRHTYTGTTTEVLTSIGVKQGCPLSAILFNLTMELILCRVEATQAPTKHFGFAVFILA